MVLAMKRFCGKEGGCFKFSRCSYSHSEIYVRKSLERGVGEAAGGHVSKGHVSFVLFPVVHKFPKFCFYEVGKTISRKGKEKKCLGF